MTRQRRKFGTAIRTLTDPTTGEVLGWVYLWDNGEESQLMKASLPPGLEADPDEGASAHAPT